MYKIFISKSPTEAKWILNEETMFNIPFDENNTMYQEYLKWVDAGNEAPVVEYPEAK